MKEIHVGKNDLPCGLVLIEKASDLIGSGERIYKLQTAQSLKARKGLAVRREPGVLALRR